MSFYSAPLMTNQCTFPLLKYVFFSNNVNLGAIFGIILMVHGSLNIGGVTVVPSNLRILFNPIRLHDPGSRIDYNAPTEKI